ncbi:N-acetylglucosamine-6-phosphate deacetylase [Nocardioides sp. cx-173]|uniref:N-acetylglucosamine-6-phosphate deacetylase n=1 Tax=Nocardioides sp. cx-173 TaxID=2898796 RepID=UPI001E361C7E|nr:N-acetylglucosamine-6-phosphate deacetylase [Nocardioides sp. cx-173]MCD4523947.1 N-acetylglucosamine-6-phosphate deacetylase [Nocardioides sp. cx-173]UGB41737.1 N-acetylglucosamine-6-phosphate deacetylase [Nocardioides sp. cx-173]
MLISAGRVVTPARVFAPGWVLVEGDRIADVGSGVPDRPADVDLPEATLVPGFVDGHAHGGGGASYDTGSREDAAAVTAAHLQHGTTTMMASLVTATPDRLLSSVAELAAAADEGVVAGIHLEGPWLSPRRAGAHDPALLTDPEPALLDALVEAGRGHLRMVTLAPELPGGLDAIRRLTAAGVVSAIGHTEATYDVARAALDAGASVGTHLFNAMRPLHHREPGPIAALLEHPDAYVELIADGVHVHPAALRLAAEAKPHLFVLVTDAMAAAAAADGDYRLGRMTVTVRDGVARLAEGGAIAGSTLTMAAAVQYAVQVAGLPIADVVRAATSTPVALLHLDRVGALRPGYRADLVVLDQDLAVQRVLHCGRWVT